MMSSLGSTKGYTTAGLEERKAVRAILRDLAGRYEHEIAILPWWSWLRRRTLEAERYATWRASEECLSRAERHEEMALVWRGTIEREISARSPLMDLVGPDDTVPIISKENP